MWCDLGMSGFLPPPVELRASPYDRSSSDVGIHSSWSPVDPSPFMVTITIIIFFEPAERKINNECISNQGPCPQGNSSHPTSLMINHTHTHAYHPYLIE